MAKQRRKFSAFSLAFLDVMSCGFGAAVLLFLIIKHQTDAVVAPPTPDLSSEVTLLQEEITVGRKGLAELRNTVDEVTEEVVITEGLAQRIINEIKDIDGRVLADADSETSKEIEQLKSALKEKEAQKQKIQAEIQRTGENLRRFAGQGQREYLTGLKIGGKRSLVLLDASASMLDESIVNIIRRRNMDDATKVRSKKWQQALATVDWLTARLPAGSQYQIYTFNTQAQSVVANTTGRWLNVTDLKQLNAAVAKTKKVIPEGGTSLEAVFVETTNLLPQPDNVYLITDGLPTQGMSAIRATTVNGRQRLKYFDNAVRRLAKGTPINVVLLPLEGDPMAASSFWKLAAITQGSYMAPAGDWP